MTKVRFGGRQTTAKISASPRSFSQNTWGHRADTPKVYLMFRLGQLLLYYKLRSPPKLGGAPLYMGFLYGVKIARLDDYMGFLYGAPPDLTVHFWAQKTQNNVSQKAQMLLQKIVTDSLPPPRFTASTTTLVSLPGRKPVLTTLARVPDPVVRVWTARKICVANPTQKKKNLLHFSITARTWRLGTFWVL